MAKLLKTADFLMTRLYVMNRDKKPLIVAKVDITRFTQVEEKRQASEGYWFYSVLEDNGEIDAFSEIILNGAHWDEIENFMMDVEIKAFTKRKPIQALKFSEASVLVENTAFVKEVEELVNDPKSPLILYKSLNTPILNDDKFIDLFSLEVE